MDKKLKYLLFGLGLLVLIFIVYILNYYNLFNIESIRAIVEGTGIFAPLIFMILYVIISLFGVSAAAMTILAGTLFGLVEGLIIVVIAATVSATIAFYVARYFSKRFIKKKIEDKNLFDKLVDRIDKTAEKKGFMTIAILRLSFMPYIPLSYAAGLVKSLKSIDFVLATFITNIFGSFVFIFLGASIVESLPLFILAIILLILFLQLPKLIKKFSK